MFVLRQRCMKSHVKSAGVTWISKMRKGYFLAFVFFWSSHPTFVSYFSSGRNMLCSFTFVIIFLTLVWYFVYLLLLPNGFFMKEYIFPFLKTKTNTKTKTKLNKQRQININPTCLCFFLTSICNVSTNSNFVSMFN